MKHKCKSHMMNQFVTIKIKYISSKICSSMNHAHNQNKSIKHIKMNQIQIYMIRYMINQINSNSIKFKV